MALYILKDMSVYPLKKERAQKETVCKRAHKCKAKGTIAAGQNKIA